MVQGSTRLDLHQYDTKRFHPSQAEDENWVRQKTHERHVKTYFVAIPWDQPLAARRKFTRYNVVM